MFGNAVKRGRPYLGNVNMFMRATPSLEEETKERAARAGKSLSEYIRDAVIAANKANSGRNNG
jgi:predicted HicB family RNase H-like nuclease